MMNNDIQSFPIRGIISRKALFLSVVCSLLFLSSCRAKRPAVAESSKELRENSYELREKETLKPVFVKPDSAMVRALFECDSANHVIMRQLSQNGTPGTVVNASLENGLFQADFKSVHDTIRVPVKERSEIRKERITITITKTVTIKNMATTRVAPTWWQKGLMYLGLIPLCYGLFRLLKYGLKFYNPLKK